MKKNLLAIALGGAAVWYFFLRKKTAPATMLPAAAVIPTQAGQKYVPKYTATYPAGLKDNMFVKGVKYEEVYLLQNGQKLPVTYDWWILHYGNDFSNVNTIDDAILLSIPVGATISI
jgi:hypothetical protein